MSDTNHVLSNLAQMIDLALNGEARPAAYDFSLVVFRAKDRRYRSNFVASCSTKAMLGAWRNVAEQLGETLEPVAPVPDEWQPIAAAPTDGTVVDLWIERNGWYRGRVADAFMDGKEWKTIGTDTIFEPVERNGARITHWRPLPPDPKVPE